jgi:hypothetical protein
VTPKYRIAPSTLGSNASRARAAWANGAPRIHGGTGLDNSRRRKPKAVRTIVSGSKPGERRGGRRQSGEAISPQEFKLSLVNNRELDLQVRPRPQAVAVANERAARIARGRPGGMQRQGLPPIPMCSGLLMNRNFITGRPTEARHARDREQVART